MLSRSRLMQHKTVQIGIPQVLDPKQNLHKVEFLTSLLQSRTLQFVIPEYLPAKQNPASCNPPIA